jgi:hypothetical protein
MDTRTFRALAAFVLLALLLTPLASGTLHAQRQPAPPSGVEPASGSVGTTFTFYFGGFEAGETIEYWVVGPGTPTNFDRGEFVADPDEAGTTFWTWTAPSGVWTGEWGMSARGITTNMGVHIPFMLSGNVQRPVYQTSVTPERGEAGTTFTFSTDAWPKGDVVDYWILPPGRERPFDVGRIYGEEGGITEWSWEAPDTIWAGTWTMNARGEFSEAFVRIPFVLDGPPPPAPPTSSVTPGEGPPGAVLTFTATGYEPNEEIAFWVNTPNETVPPIANGDDELFANRDGTVTWQWAIPIDAVAGRWTMVSMGRNNQMKQVIPFFVTQPGSGAGAPEGTVEPSVAVPGSEFRFTSSGFKPEELINYWVTSPAGEVRSDNRAIYADKAGNISFTWRSADSDLNGRWLMTIEGSKSVKQIQLTFEIIGQADGTPPPGKGVSPPAGAPGTTFAFFAEGFDEKEEIGWWVSSPERQTYAGGVDVFANIHGRFEGSWTSPEWAIPGTWSIIIQGVEETFEPVVIEVTITADDGPPAAPPPPPYTVTPEAGPPGTTFSFEARGLQSGEDVGYWANAPDRTIYPGPHQISANRQGILRWEWTAPEDAMPGKWTMAVQSSVSDEIVSNAQFSIPFHISAE